MDILDLDVIAFATIKHQGQIRKFSGEEYIAHPIRVAMILTMYTNDHKLLSAAILHDTIEDTNTTFDEINTKFGRDIADIVKSLTNDPEEIKRIGKTQHLLEKISKMDTSTLLIKLADRLDNVSDITFDPTSKLYNWSLSYAAQTNILLDQIEKRIDVKSSLPCLDLIKKIRKIVNHI